jgi:hypothetical protein
MDRIGDPSGRGGSSPAVAGPKLSAERAMVCGQTQGDTMDAVGPERYLGRMRACATAIGREFREPPHVTCQRRLAAEDVELLERGLAAGVIRIDGNYIVTQDPWQGTAWLVEGTPASPCWEYLPHIAGYVELILDHAYPAAAVGFETGDKEMNLDLPVVSDRGSVLVLGEAKAEARQVHALARDLQEFRVDPGKAPPKSRPGSPTGTRREAWKLAHQLWTLRSRYLWLVASGERMAFRVSYDETLQLSRLGQLPAVADLWPRGFDSSIRPRVQAA